MTRYKLTTQALTTHNGFQWKIGVPCVIEKKGNAMCSDEVIHFYNDPRLAIIANAIHADIPNPRLFACRVTGIVAHDGLKGGCKKMTLVRELPLPAITIKETVEFAIRCAMLVYQEKTWVAWAENWLSGKDRSKQSATRAAARAVNGRWQGRRQRAMARAAKWTAARRAVEAGWAAEWTAKWTAARRAVEAGWAAEWAAKRTAAKTAVEAGWAAEWTAKAAKWTAARTAVEAGWAAEWAAKAAARTAAKTVASAAVQAGWAAKAAAAAWARAREESMTNSGENFSQKLIKIFDKIFLKKESNRDI